MSAILKQGDKILITNRRLFDKEEPRYFVGEVIAYEAGVIKTGGLSFVRDITSGAVIRKDEPRTKIVSVASFAFLIYQLPDDVDILTIRFENEEGHQYMTDGKQLRMNLAEFPHLGQL